MIFKFHLNVALADHCSLNENVKYINDKNLYNQLSCCLKNLSLKMIVLMTIAV